MSESLPNSEQTHSGPLDATQPVVDFPDEDADLILEETDGSDELPESDAWVRLVNRWWGRLSCTQGLAVLVGLGTWVVLSLMLSFDYLAVDRIIENGVSKQDVIAPFTMEVLDEQETSHRQDIARQSIETIYKPKQPINQETRERGVRLFQMLDSLNPDNGSVMLVQQKEDTFYTTWGRSKESSWVFHHLVTKPSNDEYRDRLRLMFQVTLDHLLEKTITPSQFFDARDSLILAAMPSSVSRSESRDLVRCLISLVLQPNLVEDEEQTTLQRNKMANQIKPVRRTFHRGESILSQGEYATGLKIAALEQMGKSVRGINWRAFLGVVILCGIFIASVWRYLYSYQNRRFFRARETSMIAVLILVGVFSYQLFNRLEWVSPFAFPLATITMCIGILTEVRIGMVVTLFMVFLLAMAAKADFYALSVLFFGSMMGVYVLSRRITFRDRNQLIWAGLSVSLINIVLIVALHLVGASAVSWTGHLHPLYWDGLFGLLSGVLASVLTNGVLPLLEMCFGLLSPFSLMELANHDQPLLKRMQFEAPGTFHHSLMVASLSEAAAEVIGANPLLTRVGCLYHDIGKMKRPLFFIENQAYFGVENPHDRLSPRLSKMVITAHPRDSLEMAKEYKLPHILTHFMTEHHGTLVAGYFYNLACKLEGAENVNKSQYRYPGPKPHMKETAIVMLADACESAVRALKNPTVQQIEERIDLIIRQRIDDGQFDHCPITFGDIQQIKQTFVRVLRGIQHSRIEYQQNVMQELGRKSQLSTGTKVETMMPNTLMTQDTLLSELHQKPDQS